MKRGWKLLAAVAAAGMAGSGGIVFAGNGESGSNGKYGDVVVTAARVPRSLRDVGVSGSVVTGDDIRETGALTVGDALKNEAGIKVDSYGSMGAAAGITIRGSTLSQVLVLVDGRPVNLPSLGSVDLSMYPVYDVERIEVMRGPASVLYGAGALAGVVNVVTRDLDGQPATETFASYGTYNTLVFGAGNAGSVGGMKYHVGAGRHSSDGYRVNDDAKGYRLFGKGSFDIGEESAVTLSAGHTVQDRGVPGATTWPSPNAAQDDEKNWLDLTCAVGSSAQSQLIGKLFFARHWQEYKDPDIMTDDIARNYQHGLDVQHSVSAGDVGTITWGVFYELDRVAVDDSFGVSRIGGDRKVGTAAIYLQDEMKAGALVVTPGIRYDHHSEYGSELSPRISGLCKLAGTTSLRASVGRGYRGPSVNDLYWIDAFSSGNTDLEPERSIGYDCGIEQRFGGTLCRVSLFRNDIENMITWDDADGDGVWQSENVAEARTQGVEAELKTGLGGGVSGSVSYTYLDAEDTAGMYDGNSLRYKPRHKGGCKLRYRHQCGLGMYLGAEYNGSVYADQANARKLDRYVLLDAGISYDAGSGMEVFVSGDNLLDEEYEIYEGYPMPGTRVSGGIRIAL